MGTTIGIWLLKNKIEAAKKDGSKDRPKRRQRIAKLESPCAVPIIAVNALILAGILVFSFLAIVSIALFL